MVAIRRDDFTKPVAALAPPRPPRRDTLPEHTPYRDTGCEVHSSCLTCPLARCRFDEPGGLRKASSTLRDRSIVRAQREGAKVENIAERFGVSRRTVFRALAKARTHGTGGKR